LIDSHITEDAPAFMSRFDPEQYVAMAKQAGAESAMIYACCHNGNCYYPTKVGHMHKNLGGKDIFGMTVNRLRNAGIAPIAYYTVIYHNHAAKSHPPWRMTDASGQQHKARYWHCCPNNRDCVAFFKAQIGEIIDYDIDGIFIDMTFWAKVCCCANCQQRYLQETGKEIPDLIDWDNPAWVKFQRARETWMAQFAQGLTDYIKNVKPALTVTHQFSGVLGGWWRGQSAEIAAASDYPSGDFYDGKNLQRFGLKVMDAFRHNDMPFEFMTSRCVDIWDHTSMKGADELVCSALTILAHGGAYFFIDAINPDGTLERSGYARLGQVSAKIKSFTDKIKQLHPSICANVGLYFSMASHDDARLNNVSLRKFSMPDSNVVGSGHLPVIRELIGTSIVLGKAHLPYRIIPAGKESENISTLIVNNAKYMSPSEVGRLRNFVSGGGTLLATGVTSLCDLNGNSTGDFSLAEVFGVSFSGGKTPGASYLHRDGFVGLLSSETAPLVRATTAQSLAKVVLPYFDPADGDHYASIHSNPPGRPTEFDALTINRFGRGKCIYLYSSILGTQHDAHQQFALSLLREQHIESDILLESNAPACVEVTVLKSNATGSGDHYLLCLVNWQDELPNIPVHDITAMLKLPQGFVCETCTKVSDGQAASFQVNGDAITLGLPRLETAEFILLSVARKK